MLAWSETGLHRLRWRHGLDAVSDVVAEERLPKPFRGCVQSSQDSIAREPVSGFSRLRIDTNYTFMNAWPSSVSMISKLSIKSEGFMDLSFECSRRRRSQRHLGKDSRREGECMGVRDIWSAAENAASRYQRVQLRLVIDPEEC